MSENTKTTVSSLASIEAKLAAKINKVGKSLNATPQRIADVQACGKYMLEADFEDEATLETQIAQQFDTTQQSDEEYHAGTLDMIGAANVGDSSYNDAGEPDAEMEALIAALGGDLDEDDDEI